MIIQFHLMEMFMLSMTASSEISGLIETFFHIVDLKKFDKYNKASGLQIGIQLLPPHMRFAV